MNIIEIAVYSLVWNNMKLNIKQKLKKKRYNCEYIFILRILKKCLRLCKKKKNVFINITSVFARVDQKIIKMFK